MQRNKNHSFLKSSPSVYRHSEFLHEWTLFAAIRARAINLSRDIYSYVLWKYEINTNEKRKKNRPRYRFYTYAYTFFCSILNCAHVCLRGGTRRPPMPKKMFGKKKKHSHTYRSKANRYEICSLLNSFIVSHPKFSASTRQRRAPKCQLSGSPDRPQSGAPT